MRSRIVGHSAIGREGAGRLASLVAVDTPLAAGLAAGGVQFGRGASLRACWLGMGLRVARAGSAAALGNVAEVSLERRGRRRLYEDAAVRSGAVWRRWLEWAWMARRHALLGVAYSEHADAHDVGAVDQRLREREGFSPNEVVYTPTDRSSTGRRTGSTRSSDNWEEPAQQRACYTRVKLSMDLEGSQ